mgnify:CR=1 FL=1
MRRTATRAMGVAGGLMERRVASLGACRSISNVGTANKDSLSRAGSYNDDPQAQVANEILATDVGNKRLTDDTGTPIGSLAHYKAGGALPPLTHPSPSSDR